MGGYISSSIEAKMEKAKEGMKEMQMSQGMKQRQAQIAFQLAMGKERFSYYSVFAGTLWLVLPIAAIKHHKP